MVIIRCSEYKKITQRRGTEQQKAAWKQREIVKDVKSRQVLGGAADRTVLVPVLARANKSARFRGSVPGARIPEGHEDLATFHRLQKNVRISMASYGEVS
jgi:hypothetical protein